MSLTTNKERKYGTKIGLILAAALMASSSCFGEVDSDETEIAEEADEEEAAATPATPSVEVKASHKETKEEESFGAWASKRKGALAGITITSVVVGAGLGVAIAKWGLGWKKEAAAPTAASPTPAATGAGAGAAPAGA